MFMAVLDFSSLKYFIFPVVRYSCIFEPIAFPIDGICSNPSNPSFLYISSIFEDKVAITSDALRYDLALKITLDLFLALLFLVPVVLLLLLFLLLPSLLSSSSSISSRNAILRRILATSALFFMLLSCHD